MIITLKNKSDAISRKADRIANAHGCHILPDAQGHLHLQVMDRYAGNDSTTHDAEKALAEAGCIKVNKPG